MPQSHLFTIIGAGPVGLCMAMLLQKQGFATRVYEKRKDPRIHEERGRSINLALSDRGFRTLSLLGLEQHIKEHASIPMKGRMVHPQIGMAQLQLYSQEGKTIFSVSRGILNNLLLDEAEKRGISILFEHKLDQVDLNSSSMRFANGSLLSLTEGETVIASDGAFSAARSAMKLLQGFQHKETKLDYAYKEITIPSLNGSFQMEKGALHIWPRKSFMLIALPNTDGSFTGTLFLKEKGETAFEQILNTGEARHFFAQHFPDVLTLMPHFEKDWSEHPLSSLYMETCAPWNFGNQLLLLGDAAHAIVPFYGQGLNAGLEDCRLLHESIENFSITEGIARFASERPRDTEAIGQLALQNFIEMRDLVTDPIFLKKGKLESKLKNLYPQKWQTQYEMVTFSHLPYHTAQIKGKENQKKLDIILENEILTAHLLEDELTEQDQYLLSLLVL